MSENPFVQVVSDQTFEENVLRRSDDVPVLVDFWADWCNPCKMLMPILDRLASEYAGKFVLAKVDTDQERELASAYGIRSLPTVKVFRHGKPVDEFMGALPEASIREIIERHVDRPADQVIATAKTHLADGNPEAAVKLLTEALVTDPTYLQLRLCLAQAQIAAGDAAGAADTLATLPANEAVLAEVKQIRAQAEIAASNQGGLSVDALRAEVEENPEDWEARLQLGQALLTRDEQIDEGLSLLIDTVGRARGQSAGEQARQIVIQAFDSLGQSDPRVSKYRRELAKALN